MWEHVLYLHHIKEYILYYIIMGFIKKSTYSHSFKLSDKNKDNVKIDMSSHNKLDDIFPFLNSKWKDATKKERKKMIISAYDVYAF